MHVNQQMCNWLGKIMCIYCTEMVSNSQYYITKLASCSSHLHSRTAWLESRQEHSILRVCFSSSDPPGKFQSIISNGSQCFLPHSFQFTVQWIILPFDVTLPEIITLLNKPLTYSTITLWQLIEQDKCLVNRKRIRGKHSWTISRYHPETLLTEALTICGE